MAVKFVDKFMLQKNMNFIIMIEPDPADRRKTSRHWKRVWVHERSFPGPKHNFSCFSKKHSKYLIRLNL